MKINKLKYFPTINVGIQTEPSGKYFIKVFGCQYNEWDGARLDFMLQKLGLTATDEKNADVIFLLSCSVRKTAVDRVMGMVKNNQGKRIIVTGCVLDDDKKKYEKKNVTLWDINKFNELPKLLFEDKSENFSLRSKYNKQSNHLAIQPLDCCYLPIMTGCNNFCSYCAVPYVRGREKSRPLKNIVGEFKKLIASGHKVITLLGQNVNSYALSKKLKVKSIKYKNNFAILLEILNNIPGDFIIKFTSNHPKDMTDDIIAAVRDLPKVAKEIHLPFQSGNDKILKAMNRPYTIEQYLKLVDKIKQEIPNVKISTDTIVGFPGETEADFQDTVKVLKRVKFVQSYNNKYSPRPGTAAFKLGDPILWKEKQRRWRILNNITNRN